MNSKQRPDKDDGRTVSVRRAIVSDFLGVTWKMALPVVMGTALGLWLDDMFGTKPYLFVSVSCLGLLVGLWMGARVIRGLEVRS